jgi:hypothetical protein
MLSSLSGRMQIMAERQFQGISWTVKYPHQLIDRNWNILLQLGDIKNIGNPPPSELNLLKNRVV